MKIAIGSDHRGFEQKSFLISKLKHIEWIDVGCYSDVRSDYPVFAEKVAMEVVEKNVELGVLLCGTGIGMSIAANRYKGIYAGLVWNTEVAKRAREDDNVNILVLPSDFISLAQSVFIVEAWISATFKGGVYKKRLDMID